MNLKIKLLGLSVLFASMSQAVIMDPKFVQEGVIGGLNRTARVAADFSSESRNGFVDAILIVKGSVIAFGDFSPEFQLSEKAERIYQDIWQMVRDDAEVQEALRATLATSRLAVVEFTMENRKERAEADPVGYAQFIAKALKIIVRELALRFNIQQPSLASNPNAVQNLLTTTRTLPEHLAAVETYLRNWFVINQSLIQEDCIDALAASFYLNMTPFDRLERSRGLQDLEVSHSEIIDMFINDDYATSETYNQDIVAQIVAEALRLDIKDLEK